MIFLVTGNESKFISARKKLEPLNITIRRKKLEIVEPQSEDIRYITKYKATQSYNILKKPVLVVDYGVSIPSLNGFPGPFMRFIKKWLKVEDLINLIKDKKDRMIIFKNVLSYKDNKYFKTFSVKRRGVILHKAKGEGIPIDQIVTFRKDKKTIAECEEIGISRFDKDSEDSLWIKFGKWYKDKVEK